MVILPLLCCLVHTVLSKPLDIVTSGSTSDEASTPDMLRTNGYPCEIHEVITEDGFVLGIHRVPGGRNTSDNTSLTPVLLQHGLFDSSAGWVLAGPGKSLAYILADQGYDVWLGNARGNRYSRTHRTLSPQDPQFWDWSWHEMGYYDLPAVIDYMLNTTGHDQVLYAGHSMGTTMFFVMCSTRPEYNAKVRNMAAMAPVVYLHHVTTPYRHLATYTYIIEKINNLFGHGEIPGVTSYPFLEDILRAVCVIFKFEEMMCENIILMAGGYDPQQFDMDLLPLLLGHIPAGTSVKTLVHYAQEQKTDVFQMFDYGKAGNMKRYNLPTPPQYNFSLITLPVSLYYGHNDPVADPTDVLRLSTQLANLEGLHLVNYTNWNHVDFLYGKDAPTLVYAQVEEIFQKYSTSSVLRYH